MSLYKRNAFVINPGFQFKFSLIVCSLIFISSLIYPFTIFEIFESFLRLDPSKATILQRNRNELIKWLMVVQFMYMSVVFLVCIFISHKVAGPMYKLQQYLKNIVDGKSRQGMLFFRQSDHFLEIADLFNQAMQKIEDEHNYDFKYLNEVSVYIQNLAIVVPEDKKPIIAEIVQKLNEIQKRSYSNSNG